MRGDDIPEMAFQTRYGNYYFLAISFSLTNSLEAFMDLINKVFQSHLDSFVIVFIDDIFVYSKNYGEHTDHLRVLLSLLKKHHIFSKYSKYEFWLRSVAFLGHIISSEGVDLWLLCIFGVSLA